MGDSGSYYSGEGLANSTYASERGGFSYYNSADDDLPY